MVYNFNTVLKDLQGNPIIQNDKLVIFKDVICPILFSAGEGFTPEEKYNAYKIMLKMEKGENVELNSEDVTLIKKIIGPQLSAGAYGQLVDLLENNN